MEAARCSALVISAWMRRRSASALACRPRMRSRRRLRLSRSHRLSDCVSRASVSALRVALADEDQVVGGDDELLDVLRAQQRVDHADTLAAVQLGGAQGEPLLGAREVGLDLGELRGHLVDLGLGLFHVAARRGVIVDALLKVGAHPVELGHDARLVGLESGLAGTRLSLRPARTRMRLRAPWRMPRALTSHFCLTTRNTRPPGIGPNQALLSEKHLPLRIPRRTLPIDLGNSSARPNGKHSIP